jgi:hypothetical protein
MHGKMIELFSQKFYKTREEKESDSILGQYINACKLSAN